MTHQMLHQHAVRYMNQNLSRLEQAYHHASTGERLQRPSDDPYGVSQAMHLKGAIAANEQYERNTNEAYLWLDETDQTIQQMVNVMHRVRELAVRGNNETLTEHDRTVMAEEVESLTEQMRQFANMNVNGNYLFNGQNTNEPPFPDQDAYQNPSFDTGARTFTIGGGIVIQANVTADELFGSGDGEAGLFQILHDVAAEIRSGESTPLNQIDKGIERMLTTAAQAGARKNRVEAVENRIQDSNVELQSMRSKIADVDFADALMKLKSEESIYQASLAASASITQLSLLDFLR